VSEFPSLPVFPASLVEILHMPAKVVVQVLESPPLVLFPEPTGPLHACRVIKTTRILIHLWKENSEGMPLHLLIFGVFFPEKDLVCAVEHGIQPLILTMPRSRSNPPMVSRNTKWFLWVLKYVAVSCNSRQRIAKPFNVLLS